MYSRYEENTINRYIAVVRNSLCPWLDFVSKAKQIGEEQKQEEEKKEKIMRRMTQNASNLFPIYMPSCLLTVRRMSCREASYVYSCITSYAMLAVVVAVVDLLDSEDFLLFFTDSQYRTAYRRGSR